MTFSNLLILKNIEDGTLLHSTNDCLEPFDYHLAKYGECAFETIECNQIHSFYPSKEAEEGNEEGVIWRAQKESDGWVEERKNLDNPAYCNGNNEMVRISNQKSNICFDDPSVYAFRQCGFQNTCKSCYEIKGEIDILGCLVCRT